MAPRLSSSLAMSIYSPGPYVLTVYCLTVACIWGIWKTKQKGPLTDLPGPPPESFFLGMNYAIPSSIMEAQNRITLAGNLRQLMREQVGTYDRRWQDTYGMVAIIKAPFGVRYFLRPL
jgi:hypothetical protein